MMSQANRESINEALFDAKDAVEKLSARKPLTDAEVDRNVKTLIYSGFIMFKRIATDLNRLADAQEEANRIQASIHGVRISNHGPDHP
jgi:hypothetical protein